MPRPLLPPPGRPLGAASTLLLLGSGAAALGMGCSDQSLGRFNTAPTASITSHVDGDEVLEAYEITVRGSASDADDAESSLVATWYLEDEVACPEAAPDEDGLTTCTLAPSPGRDKITLEVRDPDNAASSAVVTLSVVPTEAPTASILSPSPDASYPAADKLTFEVEVHDAEDDDRDLQVAWKSDIDGELDLPGSPDSSGLLTTSGYLSPGQHAITVTVTDLSGKTGTDQVLVTVTDGDPPLVRLTAPADGSVVNLGDTVVFQAEVSDDRDAPEDLLLSWESDLDGPWSGLGADSTGQATATTAALSAGVHTITLRATDSDGGFATDTLALTVNQAPGAPVVSITPPEPTTDDDLGVVVETDATDPDGDGLTYEIAWFRDGVEVGGHTGSAVPASATSRGETWRVQVQATDGYALGPVGSAEVTVGNTAPVLTSASLTPAEVTTDGTLTLVVSGSDADGDALSSTVQWTVDGVDAGTGSSTLSGVTWFDKGQQVRATVTLSDGTDTSATLTTDPVTVQNTPPEVTSLSVGPSSVGTDDTLSATVATDDDDGDAVTVRYQWTVDGVVVAETGASLDGRTWFDAGDEVVLTVTPNDGEEDGDSVSSATITVGNTAPVVSSVRLSPDPVTTDQTLSATVSSSDDDGDAVSLSYAWVVNGSTVSATGSSLSGSTWFDKGDTVYVRVTPSDASGSGTPVDSDTVTVANSPPELSSVSLSPSTVTTDTTLSASVVGSDADGDTLSYRYAWTVDGSSAGSSSSTLSGSTWFDKGQVVQVTVTPDDGDDEGAALASGSVTVQNTPPTAPVVAIAPEDPIEGEALWCEVLTEAHDADGDPVSYGFEWEVDGSSYGSATRTEHADDTVPADETLADESWTCTATADDGEDVGSSDSDTVTVGSGDVDYTGLWDNDSTIRYSCAFGYVNVNFDTWYIADSTPSISVTSSSSAQPGTMSGTFPTSSTFVAIRTIAGTCTETYQVSGTFVDDNTIEGDFTISFSGGAWCFDCTDRSWSFTATR